VGGIIKDHHEGYTEWSEFERNQKLLAANAYGKAGGVKSGRGGRLAARSSAVRTLWTSADGPLLGAGTWPAGVSL
jgi:hypothetical protein